MKIVSIAEAKARLGSYVRATEEGPVILTRNGSPVAVLGLVTEWALLHRSELAALGSVRGTSNPPAESIHFQILNCGPLS